MAIDVCTTQGTQVQQVQRVFQGRTSAFGTTFHANVDIGYSADNAATANLFETFQTAVNNVAQALGLEARVAVTEFLGRNEFSIASQVAEALPVELRGNGMRSMLLFDYSVLQHVELQWLKDNVGLLAGEFNAAYEQLRQRKAEKRPSTALIIGGAVLGSFLLSRLLGR